MKLAKRFAALLMGATLAVGSIAGLTACDFGGNGGNGDSNNNAGTDNTQNNGSQSGEMEAQIHAIYDLYKANCAENNTTPQTYEEWLASIKGADGQDGVTPHIGDDGYWWVGSQKTTVEAKGEKGDPGTNGVAPHIGENGNWFIGEEDTHVPATGAQGDKGDDGGKGADGSSFLHGQGAPAETLGKEGDLYLDVSTWDVYERTETGWSEEPIGNIKGAGGTTSITIQKDKTATIDAPAEAGTYELKITVEQGDVANWGLVVNMGENAFDSADTASWNTSQYYNLYDDLNKQYWGALLIKEGTSKLTFTAASDITFSYELVAGYEPPTLKADGQEYVVPMIASRGDLDAEGFYRHLAIPFDATVKEGCTVTLLFGMEGQPNKTGTIYVVYGAKGKPGSSAEISKQRLFSFSQGKSWAITLTASDASKLASAGGAFTFEATSSIDRNATVKIDPAS